MEELLARCSSDDYKCSKIMYCFSQARARGFAATGSEDHARSCVILEERRIPLIGKLQRFWDQGKTMCELSDILRSLGRKSEAVTWYQRGRDVGAAHGFFSLESTACEGLGWAAMEEHRHEEGLALLRNALVAAELNELDDPKYELEALTPLIMALFKTNAIDEVGPLLRRYRAATKAQSERVRFCCEEFYSILFSALLHEVLCLRTPRWEPLLTAASLLAARTSRIRHRVIRAREKTHAPVEPCALWQANGKSQEAETEVRALLDLMRENETRLQNVTAICAQILEHARSNLTILDPDVGDEELIKAVATELTRLDAFSPDLPAMGMGL
jgi:hypothetical protein